MRAPHFVTTTNAPPVSEPGRVGRVTLHMLLTITTNRPPATDLGWLLHKHPEKVQSFDLSFGRAHVFYPEADDERCTAALLLDVDPVGLARQQRNTGNELLAQYVNDRPYVASSFLSRHCPGLRRPLRQLQGSRSRGGPLPRVARITAFPVGGWRAFLRKLFERSATASRRPGTHSTSSSPNGAIRRTSPSSCPRLFALQTCSRTSTS